MKKNLLIYILGAATLILLIIAILSDHYYNPNDSLRRSAENIQKVFGRKNTRLQRDLSELGNAIAHQNGGLTKYGNFSEFEDDLKQDGFVLLAFKKDSLVFWSDNTFVFHQAEEFESIAGTVNKFENGWYYVQKKQCDSISLYGLCLIKKIYPYQNRFLKNHFDPEFGIPTDFEVSLNPKLGITINNKNGSYLFSLQHSIYGFDMPKYQNLIGLLYALFLLVGLVFIGVLIREIQNVKLGLSIMFLWGISLISLRYFMLLYGLPAVFSNLGLFSPDLFASSFFFPSLGDFLINAIFIYIFIYTYVSYCSRRKFIDLFTARGTGALIVIHILVFWLLYFRFIQLVDSLVLDSSFSLQMFVFQDDGTSVFIGFLILLLLIYSLGHFAHLITVFAKARWSLYKFLIVVIGLSAIVSTIIVALNIESTDALFYIFPFVFLIFIGIATYKIEKGSRYSLIIVLLLFVSVLMTLRINSLSDKKKVQDRMVEAMNLSTEYNSTSENLLAEMQKKIDSDNSLKVLCQHPFRNEMKVMEYIQSKYFTGYWDQYHLQITICNGADDLSIEPDNEIRNCFEFFEEMILKSGEAIPNTNFYYLNEFDGMVSYLGVLKVKTQRKGTVNIYIRLDSKVGSEGIGYPDLLLDEKVALRTRSNNYSYGKYKDHKLITSSGSFNYYMNENPFGNKTNKWFRVELDNYDHLVYQFENNAVVVSYPVVSWYNKVITIPYIFVFLYVFGLFVILLKKYPWKFRFNMSFKYRIQYSIVGLLMLFFILLGGGTVYYTIDRTQEQNNRNLKEKLQLVKREVVSSLGDDANVDLLTDRLRRLSGLIYADIHLYDPSGELITSSRPEIFEKKLQSKKMNFAAYYQLFFKSKTSFIHSEKIGSMNYLSAYESIVDENNKIIAFINLPYFLKSQELEREMFNLVLAGINLHVIMILLAIFFSVFIANKITYPLRIIQHRLKATRFGSYGEKIEYAKDDEIGSLVKEYNQMLLELGKSAEKLAQSERESAWREMARQIAHEIKNPLTPMKLNIQFLQKRFEEKSENREELLQQVSKTLIEQIDALSSIATAFSNFAKMPTANNEVLNLVDILHHVISLFRNDDLDLKLQLNGIESAMVYVDREQFVRVFVNLINNAIQSIPDDRKGQIVVEIEENENNFKACVIDNGMGIDDKVKESLFYPNFTTKSSGMGLGLAIVKNIIKNAKGDIWVDSEKGVGSCFNLVIPKAE